MLIVPTLPSFQCDLIRGFSLPPSIHHSAVFNLCSFLPAQPSQTTHGQWICSGLSPYIPSPACSAYLFPPPLYGLVYTFCSWCAGQHGQLVRGAYWALAKLKQKLQLKWGWRACPHWCDNTQKTAFKVGIRGSLLHAKRSLNPPWLMEGPWEQGKRNHCLCHGLATATVWETFAQVRGVSKV